MSDRVYTVSFTEVAVTTAVDVFEIRPADDKPCEVIGLFMSQSTDFGDSASEIIPYRVIRGFTSTGTGGATPTPTPVNRSDGAAGFQADTNNTGAATTGSTVDLHSGAFNIAVGEALWLPEGCEWSVTQADTTLVVRLASAPADSIDLSGTLYVREFG
jgi:hypothetical protein